MLPQFAADVETELMRVTGQPLRVLFWALKLAGWFHYVVVMFLTVASILLFRAAFMTKHPRGYRPIVCLVVACGCAVGALLTAYSAIYINSYHRFVDEVHDAVKQGEMRTPTRGSGRPHGLETKDERVTDTAVSVEV